MRYPILPLGAAFLAVISLASAQTATPDTWTGASSANFQDSGNWTAGAPASDLTTNYAVFTGTPTSNQPVLETDQMIGGLQFGATGGWTLVNSGNLTLGNVITAADGTSSVGIDASALTSGTDTITSTAFGEISLGTSQTWLVGTGGTLTVNGTIQDGSSPSTLTIGDSTAGGTVLLVGTNTFSGGLVINGGTLEVNSSTTTLGTGAITINNGTLRDQLNATGTYSNAINVGGTGAATINVSNFFATYTGAVTLSNNLLLETTNTANSILTLTGNISGTGNLTFALGGTNAGSAITLGAGGSSTVGSTGTLNITGTLTNDGTDTAGGTVTIYDAIGSGVSTVTQDSANSNLVLSAYSVNGSTQSGTDSYANLDIDAGTVTVHYAGDQGTGTISFDSSAAGTATLNFNGLANFSSTIANAISVSGTGTNVIEASSFNPTLSGNITLNNSNLTFVASNTNGSTLTETGGISGTGNLFFQDNLGSGSNISVTSATNTIDNVGSITNNGTAAGSTTIDEVIGNNVTNVIEDSTTSALTLNGTNGANAFTGSLEIEAGTVNLENSSSTGAVASTGTIDIGTAGNGGAAATLNWNHSITSSLTDTVTNAINVGGTGTDTISVTSYDVNYTGAVSLGNNLFVITNNTGGSDIHLSGNITGTGNITLESNAAVTTKNSRVYLAGASINNVGTITNSGTGSATTGTITTYISGVIGTNVTGVIEDSANSTLDLSGANLFTSTATTTLGTLELDNSLALQDATLDMNGGSVAFGSTSTSITAATVAGLEGNGNLALTNASTTPAAVALTVGNNNGSASYSGVLSGSGSLIKTGTGTQTLSGANTYTGTTQVNQGILNVTGSLGNTTTTVASGGTFGGTGTSAGATEVKSGGFLLAGDGINVNTKFSLTNNLTMDSGSILEFTLGANNTNSSLALSGTTNSFASGQLIDFLDIQSGTYTDLITGLTSDPDSESTWTLYNDNGYDAIFTYSNGDISAVVTAAPEPPSTLLLLAGGLMLAVAWKHSALARRAVRA